MNVHNRSFVKAFHYFLLHPNINLSILFLYRLYLFFARSQKNKPSFASTYVLAYRKQGLKTKMFWVGLGKSYLSANIFALKHAEDCSGSETTIWHLPPSCIGLRPQRFQWHILFRTGEWKALDRNLESEHSRNLDCLNRISASDKTNVYILDLLSQSLSTIWPCKQEGSINYKNICGRTCQTMPTKIKGYFASDLKGIFWSCYGRLWVSTEHLTGMTKINHHRLNINLAPPEYKSTFLPPS